MRINCIRAGEYWKSESTETELGTYVFATATYNLFNFENIELKFLFFLNIKP